MRVSRAFRYFLLIYQALFLGVLLPGHTRGSITTDSPAKSTCCCWCEGNASAHKTSTVPSQRDRTHCAICQFAAGLITPPVMTLTLDELGLLETLPATPALAIISLHRIPTYLACGPPVSTVQSAT